MIAFLNGTIKAIGSNYAIFENQGIGYRVTLPLATLLELHQGNEAEFYIHEHQRDDGRELYGFKTFDELQLADTLLTVSGVGPKIAQVLVGLGVDRVRNAIRAGDVTLFLSVSGIGKKRAQQIILELKGTIDTQNLDGGAKDDVAQALEQLGYAAKEVIEVMKKIAHGGSTEARLREALVLLGR